MPIEFAFIIMRQVKPGDLCHPVADRDQRHFGVWTATHANPGNLVKWYVDHAANSQTVVVRSTFFHHGERVSANIKEKTTTTAG
jgi:hypothetical protein